MRQGLLIGFIAGAAVASLLFRALESRHSAGSAPAGVEVPRSNPGTGMSPAAPEDSVESLRQEIAALKAAAAVTRLPTGRTSRSWETLVGQLLAARKEQDSLWDTSDPLTQELMFEVLARIREEAARLGINAEEVAASPAGLAALAEALAASADPPMDGPQRARLHEALARLRAGWDEYAKRRGTLSRLEMSVELDRLTDALDAEICAALPEPHLAAWDDLRDFLGSAAPAYGSGVSTDLFRSTDELVAEWTDTWGRDLGFNEAQKVTLRTLVEEHVRELERLHAAMPHETTDPFAIEREVRLQMIRTHRRIADSVTLTEAQAKALRSWTRTEDFQVWGR